MRNAAAERNCFTAVLLYVVLYYFFNFVDCEYKRLFHILVGEGKGWNKYSLNSESAEAIYSQK